MRFFVGALLIGMVYTIQAQEPFFLLDFEEASGSTATLESNSSLQLPILNLFDRPERVAGPFGNALRFDGHSTYIQSSGFFDFNANVQREFAVEVWYATESFNGSSLGLISQQGNGRGFQLTISPFGLPGFQIFADGSNYFVRSDSIMPVYEWTHLVAQVNLDNQRAEIYLNGVLAGQRSLGVHDSLSFTATSTNLLIGRSNAQEEVFGFNTTTANGALDRVALFNTTFNPEEILARYNSIGRIETDLFIDPAVRHPDDYLRPRYHFMPNTSWANEAYGFTYFNDRYHLFFQKNPNAPILNFMHWGHLSSPDLVTWKEERMVLRPQSGFSSIGVWSGTTFFNENEEPVIAYTGVNGAFAGIGIAEFVDSNLLAWEPVAQNPVIDRVPSNIPNQDFRDPYVWKEGDTYYMVVGSGKAGNAGGLLMSYTSQDYINWVSIPPIFETFDPRSHGRFWEMPYFNRINETDYLFVATPVNIGAPARAIYWVGSFDGSKFTPYEAEPRDMELISRHMLAPAIGQDSAGQLTYIGIIPEDRNVADQEAAGWRQTFSVPRVLRLLDDQVTLATIPHPNLCRARGAETLVEERTIQNGTSFNLPEYQGIQSELEFEIYAPEVDKFSIQVYKSESGGELTRIVIDKGRNQLGINRTFSSPYNTVEDSRISDYTYRADDSLRVRVFLDHSTLEVFVDDLVVLSARVYPSMGSDRVDLVVEEPGSLELVRYRAWDIGDKEQAFPEISCPPGALPNRLFTSTRNPQPIATNLVVSPNPAIDRIDVVLPVELQHQDLELQLFDSIGRMVHQRFIPNTGTNQLSIDLQQIQYLGMLFGQLQNAAGTAATFRFIKEQQ